MTLKEISLRRKALIAMSKVFYAMKMMSLARFKQLENVLVFSRHPMWSLTGFNFLKDCLSFSKIVYLLVSTDKGFCGGMNSSLFKLVKKGTETFSKEKMSLVCFGDKARDFALKEYPAVTTLAFRNICKKTIDFDTSLLISSLVYTTYGFENKFIVFYNRFKSLTTNLASVTRVAQPALGASFSVDSVSAAFDDFFQFLLVFQIYNSIAENLVAEASARVAATTSSLDNAKQIVDNLKILQDRTRQALITTELVEIVSGAQAVSAEV